MSSAAYLTLGRTPTLNEWAAFTQEHGIEYSARTVGGHTYYRGGLHGAEVSMGHDGRKVTVSTFYMGEGCGGVAETAKAFLKTFGGSWSADPEIRARMGDAFAHLYADDEDEG